MVFKESILKRLTPVQIKEICQHILPNGRIQGAYWKVGSVNGEKGQSLSISLDEAKAGLWKDFATGEGGNVLELIKSVLHLDIKQVFEWLETRFGNSKGLDRKYSNKPYSHKTDNRVSDLWERGIAVKGTLGEQYFQNRGIYQSITPSIRFIKDLYHYPSKTKYPALLCSIQNHLGEIKGVHRIYLSEDGKGKANVRPAKMTLGKMKGHAIRLNEASTVLGICEGVENGLSVLAAGAKFPVWSAISASNMPAIHLPHIVKEVILLTDGDDAGDRAALKAAERFFSEGKLVKIVRPPRGKDFNDVLCCSKESSDDS